jgi:hypothetical protein
MSKQQLSEKSPCAPQSLGFLLAKFDKTSEPEHDLAKCSQCGWKGAVAECGIRSEGDWESGYYEIHTCPKCKDGGCVDEYEMTPNQADKWQAWHRRREQTLKNPKITE